MNSAEEKFIKEEIIPLLNNLGFERIRFNHGNREFGKDVVFSEIDRFGNRVYYGVQAKCGDISGGADSFINTISNEIDDAFDVPYYSTELKEDCFLSRIFVICSGKYTSNAIEKISQKITKRKSNVIFIDGERIKELQKRTITDKKNLKLKLNILINEFNFNIDVCKRILDIKDLYPGKTFSGNFRTNTLEDFLNSFIIEENNISQNLEIIWNNLINCNKKIDALMYTSVEQKEMHRELIESVEEQYTKNLPLVRDKLLLYLEKNFKEI